MLLLSLPLLGLATFASADAMSEASALAGGASAARVMDGRPAASGGEPVAATAPGGRFVRTSSGATLALSPRTNGPAPEAAPKEPGFFSKAWDFVKTPTFLVPASTTLSFGAMGAMIAGPLGALTGMAIGGLLGFIFLKALG